MNSKILTIIMSLFAFVFFIMLHIAIVRLLIYLKVKFSQQLFLFLTAVLLNIPIIFFLFCIFLLYITV